MYKISFHYYERDERDRVLPKGEPYFEEVVGETLKETVRAYHNFQNTHDCFKYTLTIFDDVEEI